MNVWKWIGSGLFVSAFAFACAGGPNNEEVTEVPTGLPWSDPETWGGRVPAEGEDVVIPAGRQVLLDVSPPALGSLRIDGTLVFDDRDLELTAEWIMVHGRFRVGHPDRAYTHRAVITLTGTDLEDDPSMGTRGIMTMGSGTLDFHGRAPERTWSKLAAHLEAGASTFELVEETGWSPGDELVIAPTDYFRIGRTERGTLASLSGAAAELESPVERFHWGRLQYVGESGITLEPTTEVTESVLDERAEVGNLSRNIVIQAPDDDAWKERGLGAHVMIMRGGEGRFDGVQFRRVGQAGQLARYPVHWHLWSYSGSEADGEDATNQYVRNSAVWESANRCVVLHATNGVTVSGNVCYDISGHAIFLENAVERRNVIENNLVLHVKIPPQDRRLVRHDDRSAGFWLTNPDNTVRGNVAADSEGMGYWLAYPEYPINESKDVPMQPSHLHFGVFDDNVAHSNKVMGMMFDEVPSNDEGDVIPRHYRPTNDETADGNMPVPYAMNRVTFYKHETEWQTPNVSFWNRTHYGSFLDFVTADFNGTAFAGASICTIARALVVGSSLNNDNDVLVTEADTKTLPGAARLGAASYHSDCEIEDNVFVNLPAVPGQPSGAFGTSDYYITGVDKGLVHNPNNRFINAHPGYRSISPNNLPIGEGRQNYSLAGALWDPYGYWGPAGNYWVYDLPFLTEGTECSAPIEPHGNDRSCVGPYFGVLGFLVDDEDPYNSPGRTRPIRMTRTDNGASWFVDDGDCTPVLGPMRNLTALQGAPYRVEFPSAQTPGDRLDGTPGDTLSCDGLSDALAPPTDIAFSVTNILEESNYFLLAVPFSGAATPTVVVTSRTPADVYGWASYQAYQSGNEGWQSAENGRLWRPIEPAANLAAVEASAGELYWQDTANSLVWLKVARMGIEPTTDPATDLYLPLSYRLRVQ